VYVCVCAVFVWSGDDGLTYSSAAIRVLLAGRTPKASCVSLRYFDSHPNSAISMLLYNWSTGVVIRLFRYIVCFFLSLYCSGV
jgi:hypothetical protein